MSGEPTAFVAEAVVGTAAPRTARRRRRRWAVVALVVVVLLVVGVLAGPMVSARFAPAPPAVATTPAEAGTLVVTASADGVVEPGVTEEVFAEVGGTVEAVEVEVGDMVEAGDRLFTIDDADVRDSVNTARLKVLQSKQQLAASKQQVASARQQVGQAESQVSQAVDRLDELESLEGTRAATGTEIDQAEKDVEVARLGKTSANAGLASAQASLASAQAALDDAQADYEEASADLKLTTVVAPRGGVVTSVNVSEGGSVSAGQSVSGAAAGGTAQSGQATTSGSSSSAAVVIADDSELLVTVAVNEVDIAEVEEGQEATVTFDAVDDLELTGRVAWVSPNAESDGSVSTFDVEIELATQDERVRSGMTATADIVTLSVDDAVLVPKSAVRVDGSTKYVTVMAADGEQQRRDVTTGPSDDTRIQVVSGISAGERIVTVSSAGEEEQGGGFMPPSPSGLGGGRSLNGAPGGAPPGMGGGN